MGYIIYLWAEVILAGGYLIYLGFHAPDPQCIVCTSVPSLAVGLLTVAVGLVGAARTFSDSEVANTLFAR
jgi:uncharacterized membrane protein